MTIRIVHKERKRKIVTQLCLTLVDPTDCNPSGSSLCAVPQARNLEWVATPFSRVSSLPRDRTRVSCIAGRFFSTWATSKAPECFIGVRIWTWYQRKKSIKAVAHSLMKQKHKKSIPWRRKWQPTPVFLPGESHEQRSLAGYSPRGRRVGHDWSDLAHTHTQKSIPVYWDMCWNKGNGGKWSPSVGEIIKSLLLSEEAIMVRRSWVAIVV